MPSRKTDYREPARRIAAAPKKVVECLSGHN